MSSLRPYKVKRDFRSGVVGSKLRLDDSKLDSFCTVDGGEAGDTIVGKDMDETGDRLTHYIHFAISQTSLAAENVTTK